MLKLIRKACKDDIKSINVLGEKLHNNFAKTFHLETEIDSVLAIVLVVEIKGDIVGYLYALDFGDNIDLLSIFIEEEYRYQHLGYDLLKYLMEREKNKTITLEVSSNNVPAMRLYQKLEFRNVGTRKKYYENSDAIIMKWGI